jgi:hypothetical protein
LGCGTTGKQDKCNKTFHPAILGCFASNARHSAQSG